ncbi:hypothetical protein [Peptoniphilus harei]|uniref:hypothetical protein n=1 Tax=Peptoniphilus harei TaxID=54005 RepID=UPI001910B7B7|nr:hypothetical protein [Peptoniphilus harei]QQE46904.1 hypothetical protein I6H69_00010 [Peptoniphilus harei]
MGDFYNRSGHSFDSSPLISSTGRIKEVLKLKKVPMKSLGLTIILVILIYPVILLFNGVFLSLLSNFIEYKNFPMELMLQNVPIFNYLIFMCLVPAICEEVFFRELLPMPIMSMERGLP